MQLLPMFSHTGRSSASPSLCVLTKSAFSCVRRLVLWSAPLTLVHTMVMCVRVCGVDAGWWNSGMVHSSESLAGLGIFARD